MKTIPLKEINDEVRDCPEMLIIESEAAYEHQIREVAEEIMLHAEERPITLIAGPSGSGKTTTACRIEQILDAAGYESHTLSMDNYYADGSRNANIVDQYGNPDYESPLRLDAALLSEQLESLARGEAVELPRFDFAAQKQCKSGRVLRRKPKELIIMEGIHALNPDVTAGAHDNANRIYLSVRTRITNDNAQLHPSLIRFARRLLRDSRSRGRTPEETLSMLSSISRGENLYIMPYKHYADYELDTFMPYELAVYTGYLLDTVRSLAEAAPADSGIPTLLHFMEHALPLEPDWIPDHSLVREFVGGSSITD